MVRGSPATLRPRRCTGIVLGFGGGVKFGFDGHRRAARGGNQYVGVAAGVVGEGLGVFGIDFAGGHHAHKQVAQGIVGAGFGLFVGGQWFAPGVKDWSLAEYSRGLRECRGAIVIIGQGFH